MNQTFGASLTRLSPGEAGPCVYRVVHDCLSSSFLSYRGPEWDSDRTASIPPIFEDAWKLAPVEAGRSPHPGPLVSEYCALVPLFP